MSFTSPSITHTFINADGSAGSGAVQFTLLGPMRNGTTSIVPAEVTANLDASGSIAQTLVSNLDTGTYPAAPGNMQWRCDMRVLGLSQTLTYTITVPPIQIETAGSTKINTELVQLSALTASPLMLGQSITGTGIPASSTVTAVNVTSNQVTISANASATGTGLTLTIGATIDLGVLLPTADQAG